ncbi:MAG: PPOX class F420-dependent oxidoreductase [Thermomicrobiales bacterium]|nr:PPOX class F420-dependent oxidoreductase [Thermomicrobiales bacterium]
MTTASASVPESFYALLEQPLISYIATIGPKGEPQVSPVWHDWDGEFVRVAVLEETQKARNVDANGTVAFTVIDPETPARYIEIRGTVTRHLDRDDEYGDRLARKYLGKDHLPWSTPDVRRWILTIHPTRVITT